MITIPARVVVGTLSGIYLLSTIIFTDIMNLSIVAMVRTPNSTNTTTLKNQGGDFDWSESTQGLIMSAYFWGYIVMLIPGGRLAELVGSRRVLTVTLLVQSLLMATIPTLAHVHYGFLIAVRVLIGLTMGARYPSVSMVFSRWIPHEERARSGSLITFVPGIVSSILSPVWGIVIARLGWAVLFYLAAIQGLLVTVLWFSLVHDSPEEHPNISPEELKHIQNGHVAKTVTEQPLPWKKMACSLQVWMPVLLTIGSEWSTNIMEAFTPKYLDSIFKVDIEQNSLLITLPWVGWSVFSVATSFLADFCLTRKLLSMLLIRRISVVVSHLLPALMLVLFPLVGNGLMPAMVLLVLRSLFNGASSCGHYLMNYDMAPNFVGTLEGLSGTFGSLNGIVAPIVVGAILEKDILREGIATYPWHHSGFICGAHWSHVQPSRSGWNLVFALSAVLYVVTSVPVLCFYKSELQPWNDEEESPQIEGKCEKPECCELETTSTPL